MNIYDVYVAMVLTGGFVLIFGIITFGILAYQATENAQELEKLRRNPAIKAEVVKADIKLREEEW